MNQIKIGKFIAERRRLANLTQMQLAEKLGITDRAVSKWENGKSLPDSSIMIELCDILKISVNDLLSGEVVIMDNYNKELENNLLRMVKEKEESDKKLLKAEIVMILCSILPFLASVIIVLAVPMAETLGAIIVLASMLPLLIATPFALRIEQTTGYYECQNCKHKYVPKYSSVFWAIHVNRERYMKCPNCNQKSWHKKVISNK